MPVSIQGVRNRAGNQKHRGLCPDGTDILFAGRAGKYLQSGIKKTKWANGGERTRRERASDGMLLARRCQCGAFSRETLNDEKIQPCKDPVLRLLISAGTACVKALGQFLEPVHSFFPLRSV